MAPPLKLTSAEDVLQDDLPVFNQFLQHEDAQTLPRQPFYHSGPLWRSYIDQIQRGLRTTPRRSEEKTPETLLNVLKLGEPCTRSNVRANDGPGACRQGAQTISLPKLQHLCARIKTLPEPQAADINAGGIEHHNHLDRQQQSYIRLPHGLNLGLGVVGIGTFASYPEERQRVPNAVRSSISANILGNTHEVSESPNPRLGDLINDGNVLLGQLGILLAEVEKGASTMMARSLPEPAPREDDSDADHYLEAHRIHQGFTRQLYGPLDVLRSNRSRLFDQTDYPKNTTYEHGVDKWFSLYEKRVLQPHGLQSTSRPKRVKIAVLDTRIDRTRPNLQGSRLREVKPFYRPISKQSQSAEKRLHGSHVVALVLRMAPFANIYVAEVAEAEDALEDGILAEALDHAMISPTGWRVDILVMSFGWDEHVASSRYPLFHQALEDNNMPNSTGIIFTAASNGGANYLRTYPASRGSVFAIHATDYNGDAPTPNFNPTRLSGSMNYSTIGHQVPGDSDLVNLRVSGASFAAPVAAGIAAAIIQFFRQQQNGTRWYDYLRTYDGMSKVFKTMAVRRGDYDYLDWANFFHPAKQAEEIHRQIMDALKAA